MRDSNRLTSSAVYQVAYKELLATAVPRKPRKQGPRMYVSMLDSLEELVSDTAASPYLRIDRWWILLQNRATHWALCEKSADCGRALSRTDQHLVGHRVVSAFFAGAT